MTLAEINIEVDIGALLILPAHPAGGVVRRPHARRPPDLVPHVPQRLPRLDPRRRDRRAHQSATTRQTAELVAPRRPLQRARVDGGRDRARLHRAARRQGPVRPTRPAAADPPPRPAGRSARWRRRCASARCSTSHVRTGLLHRRFASAAGISDPEFGPRLRSTLEDCGGMFIKLGQVASTRSDLLPAPVIAELTQLQSSVPAADPDAIREVVEEELGRPVEEVFSNFNWTPLAAASIGQVHRATLVSGEDVVVKVQRPMVADVVSRDTQAMLSLARFMQRRTSIGLRTDVVTLVARVHRRGERGARLHERGPGGRADPQRPRRRRGHPRPRRPPRAVARAGCSCSKRSPGVPVSDQAALDASPVPREELAERLLQLLPRADPPGRRVPRRPAPGQHPRSPDDGTLNLLDFGSTGILDPAMLEALGGLLLASTLNDPQLLQRAVLAISPPPPGTDLDDARGRPRSLHGAAHERRQRLRRRDAPGDDRGAAAQPPPGADVAHAAQPRAHHARRDAAHDVPGLRVRGPGPGHRADDGDAGHGHRRDERSSCRRSCCARCRRCARFPGTRRRSASSCAPVSSRSAPGASRDADEAAFVRDLANRAMLAAVGLVGILTVSGAARRGGRCGTTDEANTLEGIGYVGLFLGSVITMRVVALVVRDRSA